MKTRSYTLKGKDVPTGVAGATINFPVPETQAELVGLCKSDADALELASSAFDVWLQGRLRSKAAQKKEDGTLPTADELNTFASNARYARRGESTGAGGSKPKTPKGIAQSKAAGAGNRLFEKCATDQDFLARMIRQGIVDQAEFDAWTAARSAQTQAASTPASPAAPKTPAKAGKK